MNKALKEVLVKREYHGQVWFEYINFSEQILETLYVKKTQRTFRRNTSEIDGRISTQGNFSPTQRPCRNSDDYQETVHRD